MVDIDMALKIALMAHAGQKDKGGNYYILHPLRVMAAVKTPEEKIVAILHDVLEDSYIDLLSHPLSERVRTALDCLTRGKEESYREYIDRIAGNRLAITVKIADLEDNMDITRLPVLTEKDHKRLSKYQCAWAYLKTL